MATPRGRARAVLGQLYVQVLIGIVIGALIGFFFPHFGAALKPFGDGFIKLIRMLLAPIIFGTVVVGISKMGDLKEVGRVRPEGAHLFRDRLDDRAGDRPCDGQPHRAGCRHECRSEHDRHQVDFNLYSGGEDAGRNQLLFKHHPGHDRRCLRQRQYAAGDPVLGAAGRRSRPARPARQGRRRFHRYDLASPVSRRGTCDVSRADRRRRRHGLYDRPIWHRFAALARRAHARGLRDESHFRFSGSGTDCTRGGRLLLCPSCAT